MLLSKLSCTSCGATLDVYDNMERLFCAYCGTGMIVQRHGGTVLLQALTGAIQKVQIGTDKTAAELAIVRLTEELAKEKLSVPPGCFSLILAVIPVFMIASGELGPVVFGLLLLAGFIAAAYAIWKGSQARIQKLECRLAEQKRIANA